MLTKEPDLQKWADSILATEPSERAEMVAEDPSVFEVVRKALDAERQTVAKLREALNDCEAKASLGAKMVDREHPTIADGFIIIATRAHNALKETP